MRKQKPVAELMPRVVEEALAVPESMETMLERIVRERIDKALAERIGVDPDTERQQNVFERRSHAVYFANFGCIRCNSKERRHAGKGLCPPCMGLISQRMAKLKHEWMKEHPTQVLKESARWTARVNAAEKLLGS